MPVEIERKFLVREKPELDEAVTVERIRQGYLQRGPVTVRVRTKGDYAYLTVKGPANGVSCPEFEYDIPVTHADEMLDTLCASVLEKTRYVFPHGELFLELDIFHGALDGLVMVEVELPAADAPFSPPHWFGEEVTGNLLYTNASLSALAMPPT